MVDRSGTPDAMISAARMRADYQRRATTECEATIAKWESRGLGDAAAIWREILRCVRLLESQDR